MTTETKSLCTCPTDCICGGFDHGLPTRNCPVHDDYHEPAPDCPVHGDDARKESEL